MKVGNWQETANTPAQVLVQDKCEDKPLVTDKQLVSKGFWFLSRSVNPEYHNGLRTVPHRIDSFRSCLLHHKSDRNLPLWTIKSQPKWFTDLLQTNYSKDTGEIFGQEVYRTDDLTAGNNRKIKALNAFKNAFMLDYRKRKISMFFYTFTVANENGVSIATLFNGLKKRFERNGHPLRGYVWTLEIDKDSLHIHYHALVACHRVKCQGQSLPEWLKMDDIWKTRCGVGFAKKNFNYYLAKYLVKNKWRVADDGNGKRKRQYGLKLPKK